MNKVIYSKLGLIAGGQLAKMTIQAAKKWCINTYVLDSQADCVASSLAQTLVVGNPLDYNDVFNFGRLVDYLTYDIEAVNVEALFDLVKLGVRVLPNPLALQIIQDKRLQKEFFLKHGIPTAKFQMFETLKDIELSINSGLLNFPFIQKSARGGYDGRGVKVIRSKNDLEIALDGACVVEEMVDIDTEISVIIARNASGQIKMYPPTEMHFIEASNILSHLICPADLSEEILNQIKEFSNTIIQCLDVEGICAIEIFIDKQGNVMVNEVSLRPHNSGHHTIESVYTSQFEQLLRAIYNLPLGSTKLLIPSVMINILGEPGYKGPAHYQGLEECLDIEGVSVHIYGKTETFDDRKMGHITIIDQSVSSALVKTDQIKKIIKVVSR